MAIPGLPAGLILYQNREDEAKRLQTCGPESQVLMSPQHFVLLGSALFFHLLKTIVYFPLLVLNGIYHDWKYIYIYIFSRGLNQMEVFADEVAWCWVTGLSSAPLTRFPLHVCAKQLLTIGPCGFYPSSISEVAHGPSFS